MSSRVEYFGVIPTITEQPTLMHFRVFGSKNGVRRYQYEDGSLTPLGREHYGVGPPRGSGGSEGSVGKRKKKVKDMTDDELKTALSRTQLETSYNEAVKRQKASNRGPVRKLIGDTLSSLSQKMANLAVDKLVEAVKKKIENKDFDIDEWRDKDTSEMDEDTVKKVADWWAKATQIETFRNTVDKTRKDMKDRHKSDDSELEALEEENKKRKRQNEAEATRDELNKADEEHRKADEERRIHDEAEAGARAAGYVKDLNGRWHLPGARETPARYTPSDDNSENQPPVNNRSRDSFTTMNRANDSNNRDNASNNRANAPHYGDGSHENNSIDSFSDYDNRDESRRGRSDYRPISDSNNNPPQSNRRSNSNSNNSSRNNNQSRSDGNNGSSQNPRQSDSDSDNSSPPPGGRRFRLSRRQSGPESSSSSRDNSTPTPSADAAERAQRVVDSVGDQPAPRATPARVAQAESDAYSWIDDYETDYGGPEAFRWTD